MAEPGLETWSPYSFYCSGELIWKIRKDSYLLQHQPPSLNKDSCERALTITPSLLCPMSPNPWVPFILPPFIPHSFSGSFSLWLRTCPPSGLLHTSHTHSGQECQAFSCCSAELVSSLRLSANSQKASAGTATSFLSLPNGAIQCLSYTGPLPKSWTSQATEDSSHEQGRKSASFEQEAEALGLLLGLAGSGGMS